VELRQFDAGGNLTRDVSYNYDALGRRVKITDGTAVTYQVFDGQQLIGTQTKQGPIIEQTQYLVGTRLDDVFEVTVDYQPEYLLTDVVGSVRLITDGWGIIRDVIDYGQFGNLESSTRTNDTGLGYASRPTDPGTGLVDLRARLYDAALGRFESRDPVSTLNSGLTLYQYAYNKPLVFRDPTGRTPGAGAQSTSSQSSVPYYLSPNEPSSNVPSYLSSNGSTSNPYYSDFSPTGGYQGSNNGTNPELQIYGGASASGTLLVYLSAGINAGATSEGTVFVQVQGAIGLGFGAYFSVGGQVGSTYTTAPLEPGLSGSGFFQGEASAGWGETLGVTGQLSSNSISTSGPAPHVGFGAGAALSGGIGGSGTLALPVGQWWNSFSSYGGQYLQNLQNNMYEWVNQQNIP
jgi:RHS repeat-associated protein